MEKGEFVVVVLHQDQGFALLQVTDTKKNVTYDIDYYSPLNMLMATRPKKDPMEQYLIRMATAVTEIMNEGVCT